MLLKWFELCDRFNSINRCILDLYAYFTNSLLFLIIQLTFRLTARPIILIHGLIEYIFSKFDKHDRWKYIIKPKIVEIYLFFDDYWFWKTNNPSYFTSDKTYKSRGFYFDILLKFIENLLNSFLRKFPHMGNEFDFNTVFCVLVDLVVFNTFIILLFVCYKFTRWYFTPFKNWSTATMFNISNDFRRELLLKIFWSSFSIIIFISAYKIFYIYSIL